jgi:hypothetical protein
MKHREATKSWRRVAKLTGVAGKNEKLAAVGAVITLQRRLRQKFERAEELYVYNTLGSCHPHRVVGGEVDIVIRGASSIG